MKLDIDKSLQMCSVLWITVLDFKNWDACFVECCLDWDCKSMWKSISVVKCSFHSVPVIPKTALSPSVSASWRWEASAEQRDHRAQQPPDGGKAHHREATRRQRESLFAFSSLENKIMLVGSASFAVCGSEFLSCMKTICLKFRRYICVGFLMVAHLYILVLDSREKNKVGIILSYPFFCHAWSSRQSSSNTSISRHFCSC